MKIDGPGPSQAARMPSQTQEQSRMTTVKSGEKNIKDVAKRVGVSVEDLQRQNPQIGAKQRLDPGQEIRLPAERAAGRAGDADAGRIAGPEAQRAEGPGRVQHGGPVAGHVETDARRSTADDAVAAGKYDSPRDRMAGLDLKKNLVPEGSARQAPTRPSHAAEHAQGSQPPAPNPAKSLFIEKLTKEAIHQEMGGAAAQAAQGSQPPAPDQAAAQVAQRVQGQRPPARGPDPVMTRPDHGLRPPTSGQAEAQAGLGPRPPAPGQAAAQAAADPRQPAEESRRPDTQEVHHRADGEAATEPAAEDADSGEAARQSDS